MARPHRPQGTSPRVMPLAAFAIVIAGLYFAKDFLIPFALAILFSFLLFPIVRRLEQQGLGRAFSVIIVALFSFSIILGAGWVVTQQVVDLAVRLPEYRENIIKKVHSLRGTRSTLGAATQTIKEISKEISEVAPAETALHAGKGPLRAATSNTDESSGAVPVRVIEPPPSALTIAWNAMMALLGPLGTIGAVAILVIFILLERENLRDRCLRLVGQGKLHVTTETLDDAGTRISRYLLMQFVVNATYGVPVAGGLWLIGVPNAATWGLLAIMLRYLPYLGPWIAASMPILLSFTLDGWSPAVYTISIFVFLELFSNNVMEPWLYGASAGITSVAVLAAAGFWTWLWGLPGLLLSTPLTVLLVVMGKHIPQMSVFNILLGDEEVFEPYMSFYHRLLAGDRDEAAGVLKSQIGKKSPEEIHDQIIIPALRLAEIDAHRGKINDERRKSIEVMVGEMIDPASADPAAPRNGSAYPGVLCIPAGDGADGVVAQMLARLLASEGIDAQSISTTALVSEIIEQIERQKTQIVCVSAMPPAALAHARYLCKKLHFHFPALRLVVGVWSTRANPSSFRERVNCSANDKVVSTMKQAVHEVRQLVATRPSERARELSASNAT